jgi:hypothetical protein
MHSRTKARMTAPTRREGEAEHSSGHEGYNVKHYIPGAILEDWWTQVLNGCNQLEDERFHNPVLVLQAHDLKSIFDPKPNNWLTATQAITRFSDLVLNNINLQYVDGDQIWVDLGIRETIHRRSDSSRGSGSSNHHHHNNLKLEPIGASLFYRNHCTRSWGLLPELGGIKANDYQPYMLRDMRTRQFCLPKEAGPFDGLGICHAKLYNSYKNKFSTIHKTYKPFSLPDFDGLGLGPELFREFKFGSRNAHKVPVVSAMNPAKLLRRWNDQKDAISAALHNIAGHEESYGARKEVRCLWSCLTAINLTELDDTAGVRPFNSESTHNSFWMLDTKEFQRFLAEQINRWIYVAEYWASRVRAPEKIRSDEMSQIESIYITQVTMRLLSLTLEGPDPARSAWLYRSQYTVGNNKRVQASRQSGSQDEGDQETTRGGRKIRRGLGLERYIAKYGMVCLDAQHLSDLEPAWEDRRSLAVDFPKCKVQPRCRDTRTALSSNLRVWQNIKADFAEALDHGISRAGLVGIFSSNEDELLDSILGPLVGPTLESTAQYIAQAYNQQIGAYLLQFQRQFLTEKLGAKRMPKTIISLKELMAKKPTDTMDDSSSYLSVFTGTHLLQLWYSTLCFLDPETVKDVRLPEHATPIMVEARLPRLNKLSCSAQMKMPVWYEVVDRYFSGRFWNEEPKWQSRPEHGRFRKAVTELVDIIRARIPVQALVSRCSRLDETAGEWLAGSLSLYLANHIELLPHYDNTKYCDRSNRKEHQDLADLFRLRWYCPGWTIPRSGVSRHENNSSGGGSIAQSTLNDVYWGSACLGWLSLIPEELDPFDAETQNETECLALKKMFPLLSDSDPNPSLGNLCLWAANAARGREHLRMVHSAMPASTCLAYSKDVTVPRLYADLTTEDVWFIHGSKVFSKLCPLLFQFGLIGAFCWDEGESRAYDWRRISFFLRLSAYIDIARDGNASNMGDGRSHQITLPPNYREDDLADEVQVVD